MSDTDRMAAAMRVLLTGIPQEDPDNPGTDGQTIDGAIRARGYQPIPDDPAAMDAAIRAAAGY